MALFVEERRRIILDQLQQQGRVLVKDLSDAMAVSAVTIRQDLRALEDEGLLERTYGGAVQRELQPNIPELSFHVRQNRNREQKRAIAAAAVQRVEDGYSLALDASSTVYALTPLLKNFKKLTVVTNSLFIAQNFLDSPHIQVILPGGRLRRDSISIVGKPDGLPDINFNLGFFGTRGIALLGITDVDADEVAMKSAMVARCVETVILADAGKWGQVAPYTFARLQQVTRIITTEDAPGDTVGSVEAQGVVVEQAQVAPV